MLWNNIRSRSPFDSADIDGCPDRVVGQIVEHLYLACQFENRASPLFGLKAGVSHYAAPGWDADLALVDLGARWTLRADDLRSRHRQSPYLGREFRGAVRRTLLRGHTVAVDGQAVGEPLGRLVTPRRGAG